MAWASLPWSLTVMPCSIHGRPYDGVGSFLVERREDEQVSAGRSALHRCHIRETLELGQGLREAYLTHCSFEGF